MSLIIEICLLYRKSFVSYQKQIRGKPARGMNNYGLQSSLWFGPGAALVENVSICSHQEIQSETWRRPSELSPNRLQNKFFTTSS